MRYCASRWSFLLAVVLLLPLGACDDDAANTYARIGDHDTSIFDPDASGATDVPVSEDTLADSARTDVATDGDANPGPTDTGPDTPTTEPDAELCPDVDDFRCVPPDTTDDPPVSTEPCPDGEERVRGECVPIVMDPPVECGEGTEEVNGVCVPIEEETPEPIEDVIYEGSWRITNRSDVDFILPYTKITGDLIIEARGLPGVTLPNLQEIRLDLRVNSSDPGMTYIRLPRLREIGGNMDATGEMRVLELSLLEQVGGRIDMQSRQLQQISLPSLIRIEKA